MTIQDAIDRLAAHAQPGNDLPEELFLFVSTLTPLVNVDLLIQDEKKGTLLTWRDDKFYGAGWHVPGGIIRYKEHAHERVRKVAETELGCSVDFETAPMLVAESFSPERQRGHFVSLLYRCTLTGQPAPSLEAGAVPRRGDWKWHKAVPPDLLPVHRIYAALLYKNN